MNVADPYFIYPAKPTYLPPSSSLFTRLDNDINWISEIKKNGWRCLIRKVDEKITLWTRHKTTINDELPNLRKTLSQMYIPNDSILDGELLEHRSKAKDSLLLWGIYRWEGGWLNKVSYEDIMGRVKSLVPKNQSCITTPEFVFLNKKAFYETALRTNPDNEGVVLKKLIAPVPFFWKDSKEITAWFKVKPIP